MISKSKNRVLITDLNHHIRDLLNREFRVEGYDVLCAGSETEFIDITDSIHRIDILILDPEIFKNHDCNYMIRAHCRDVIHHIIVHTYKELHDELDLGAEIPFVEKNASSIAPLKAAVRHCLSS